MELVVFVSLICEAMCYANDILVVVPKNSTRESSKLLYITLAPYVSKSQAQSLVFTYKLTCF